MTAALRILLVEDNPITRKMLRFALANEGYEVLEAGDGESALALAARTPPQLVLQDYVLPDRDGLRLMAELRAVPGCHDLPILVITGMVSQLESLREQSSGPTTFLAKPVEPSRLLEVVRRILGREESGDAGVPLEGVPAPAESVFVQLDKQVARNEVLLRQGAIQAAALSVVRGLAEAMTHPRELPSILGDVLVHCLDAAGLSVGLLYLVEPGGPRLQAQAGLSSEARKQAAAFGETEALVRVLEGGEPFAFRLVPGESSRGSLHEFLGRLGEDSALIIPFVVGEQPLGLLVLASSSQDLTERAWMGFARALAVQFGQTLALGQSLARGAASEERLRHLVASNPAVIYAFRVDGQAFVPTWISDNVERLLGYTPDEARAPGWWSDHIHPEDREAAQAALQSVLTFGRRVHEYRFLHCDGTYLWFRDEQRLLRTPEGDPLEIVGSWVDVTERKRIELTLRESEEQYRLLFDRHPHPMWVFDDHTLAFLDVNEAAVRHYGYSRDEFLSMTIEGIRPTADVARLHDYRRDAESRGGSANRTAGEWTHRKKDGTEITADISSSPIVFRGHAARLVLSHDVTEHRKLEGQFLQAQKMEAIGQLAGGIAHDFNNLLGVITGYTELILREIGPTHPSAPRAEQVRKAAERAAGLTRQLLAFSRKQVLQLRVLDLNAVVADIEKMLRRLIGEHLQLVTVFGADLGMVKADPGQVEQMIVNLAVNARDAMPNGGSLIIETENIDLDEDYARHHSEVQAGAYVTMAVSDTGHGMDPSTTAHVFEPFFTTKPEGKGTGLGLSTVYGIVKQSGGHVTVYSEVGRGTTFRIYLPRVNEGATPLKAPLAEPLAHGGETVLLAEDAEALRVLIREILEGAGYVVLEAAGPEEALEMAATHEGPIRLVLSDVVMPRMSGRQLVERLKEARPDTQALFMSGYTDDAIGHHGVIDPGSFFLQKPFTSEALLRKVREVLNVR